MSSARSTASLAVNAATKKLLRSAGFRTVADLRQVTAPELAEELGISQAKAEELVRLASASDDGSSSSSSSSSAASSSSSLSNFSSSSASGKGMSALQLLQREAELQPIFTFCGELDRILGGGVPLGKITEFCGVPGIGKTQIGIQLALDVQIPPEFGGLGGEVVYVDTEGSFVIERVVEMARGLLHHLERLASKGGQREQEEALEQMSLQSLLSGIHCYRVYDFVQQVALFNTLPRFLAAHPNVRLLVLDSVTFHFRHDFEQSQMGLRARVLGGMAQKLQRMANEANLAVVVINQVTTKFRKGSNQTSVSYLAPALGESWSHACSNRVVLFWKNGMRFANLHKSPNREQATVQYRITADGVRGMPRSSTHKRTRSTGSDELDHDDLVLEDEEGHDQMDVDAQSNSRAPSHKKQRQDDE